MPDQIKADLKARGARVSETENLEEVLDSIDVLYMTRIQKERFPDPTEYKKVAGAYKITTEHLGNVRDNMIIMHPLPRVNEIDSFVDTSSHARYRDNMIIMHPLPRVNEIDSFVDTSSHARYFEQSFYGVPIRMALLTIVMGVEV
jgi:aspartate carbamoyltransferase catalytic subunit